MARKSKAVFKMAGYTFPGASPMTNKITEKRVDVDELMEEEDELPPITGTKRQVRKASRKARKAAKKFAKGN